MFGNHFYNERVRKSVAVFGALFNNLYVIRKSGDKVLNQSRVPLAYAPQRKFLERIQQMLDGESAERQVAVKLPRMSFEITNIAYDPARQLPKTNYFTKAGDTSDARNKFYTSVPYIISFELNIYAKQHDDALQVVEQIVPYFNPQYTISVKPISGYESIVDDVPLILNGVQFSDDFEGAVEARRTIIYTLQFDMKIAFYGPKPSESAVITQVDVDLFDMDVNSADSDEYLETVRVTNTNNFDVLDSDSPISLPHAYE